MHSLWLLSLSPKTNDRVGLDVIETNFLWKCCVQGVRPVRTPVRGPVDQPNRPPASVPSVAPAARPAAPAPPPHARPATPVPALPPTLHAAPALPLALTDDVNRRRQRKEKHQALGRKPSKLASYYGCGPAMQTVEEAALRYDACCKHTFQMF